MKDMICDKYIIMSKREKNMHFWRGGGNNPMIFKKSIAVYNSIDSDSGRFEFGICGSII